MSQNIKDNLDKFLFKWSNLTSLGVPSSTVGAILDNERVYKHSPRRFNFYMQVMESIANPNPKILETVIKKENQTRYQREQIDEKIKNIIQYFQSKGITDKKLVQLIKNKLAGNILTKNISVTDTISTIPFNEPGLRKLIEEDFTQWNNTTKIVPFLVFNNLDLKGDILTLVQLLSTLSNNVYATYWRSIHTFLNTPTESNKRDCEITITNMIPKALLIDALSLLPSDLDFPEKIVTAMEKIATDVNAGIEDLGPIAAAGVSALSAAGAAAATAKSTFESLAGTTKRKLTQKILSNAIQKIQSSGLLSNREKVISIVQYVALEVRRAPLAAASATGTPDPKIVNTIKKLLFISERVEAHINYWKTAGSQSGGNGVDDMKQNLFGTAVSDTLSSYFQKLDSENPNKVTPPRTPEQVIQAYKNDPYYSPENEKVAWADRAIFAGLTYIIRALALFLTEWSIYSGYINKFTEAFAMYFGMYACIFLLVVFLTNARKDDMVFRMIFFYMNSQSEDGKGVWRIIVHLICILMLLPIPYIVKEYREFYQPAVLSFADKATILSGVEKFSLYTWILTSVVALNV